MLIKTEIFLRHSLTNDETHIVVVQSIIDKEPFVYMYVEKNEKYTYNVG